MDKQEREKDMIDKQVKVKGKCNQCLKSKRILVNGLCHNCRKKL